MALTLISKDIWNSYSPEQQESHRKRLFLTRSTTDDPWPYVEQEDVTNYPEALLAYYRVVGFPHYEPLSEAEQLKKFKSLLDYDHSNVYRDNNVHQTMHGLGLVWTFTTQSGAVPRWVRPQQGRCPRVSCSRHSMPLTSAPIVK